MKAGWLNVTVTNYRSTDALDGVLVGEQQEAPYCVPDVVPSVRRRADFSRLTLFPSELPRLTLRNGRAQPFQS